MKRGLFFSLLAALLFACVPAGASLQTATVVPTALVPITPTAEPEFIVTLHRGVNMGNMLEAPNEGDWGLTAQREYFDVIKSAGFDFIRLPIRWNTHADANSPYTIDPAFFARIDEIVGWALDDHLAIIIDFHHYEELMSDPQGNKDRFLGIWKQVAEHYKDSPATVLFELLNEPSDQLNATLWNEYAGEALAIVRVSNPTRDVIIGPVDWNAFDSLSGLEVPSDTHLIATFHYYLPFEFTHQGAEWIGPESNAWLGTTWDATEAQKAAIMQDFDSVAAWGRAHNIRILLGEFGAYSKADMDSRVRWTDFVARQAELHKFAWSYWEFGSIFGVYDPETKQWREPLLKALMP